MAHEIGITIVKVTLGKKNSQCVVSSATEIVVGYLWPLPVGDGFE